MTTVFILHIKNVRCTSDISSETYHIFPTMKMKKLLSFLSIITISGALTGCLEKTTPTQERITIGIQTSPAMALVMVAKDAGHFADAGLNVELKPFTAGKFALEALLAGSLDYAVSGDVPAALAAAQGHELVIPAQVVRRTINEVRVVARRDAEATDARTYFTNQRRSLATSIGGGPEFFTWEFLQALGLSTADVDIISQKPGDMPAALASGSVDAIAVFDPFAYLAEKQLGSESQTFTNSNIYAEVYVLEATPKVRQHEAQVRQILQALLAAEETVQQDPARAQAIVATHTGLDEATVRAIWPSFDFRVSLTPELRNSLQRITQWGRDAKKIAADAPPLDPLRMLWPTPLQALAPSAVE
jgi:NitT/TauT family transport system substrate-binding protein